MVNPTGITLLTETDMRQIFKDRCRVLGAQTAIARAAGVSNQYIHKVLTRENVAINERIAKALGYRRVVVYVPDQNTERESGDASVQGDS